ncbi:hypothetical protein MRB53_000672 [Persea americana]|uniref:Uncharacterized protein n=1 Tax=Persea americana TaxID=3435 RepID=A0ACC2MPI2_PERAE|nr:hypothetical protein MRB53_000672 [Persea americana]
MSCWVLIAGAIAGRDKVQRIDSCANRPPEKAACTSPASPEDTGRCCQSSPVAGEEATRCCSVHSYVAKPEPVEGRRRSPGPS